jgi:AbrB family looped-hinge helix DNA binding protein
LLELLCTLTMEVFVRTTVSSKFQITLPAAVRRMLRVRPGDRLEFRIDGGRVELRKVLPNPADVARQLLEEWDFRALHEETGGDAVRHVREMRWADDQP